MDKTHFEHLFRTHFERLCSFARQYVADMDTAQDICQKVFIRLWEKREEMDTSRSITSYLFTSVKNRCLNHIRDHKKYRSHLLDVECGDLEIGLAISEDHFALQELQQRIDKALATLPPKCRQVFEMSRYEQKKYKEIASELDISQKTVEAHMSKAIKLLRDDLGDYLTLLILLNML
jgi:RNA polymerase sigma-70 factor (ECF subfamily)